MTPSNLIENLKSDVTKIEKENQKVREKCDKLQERINQKKKTHFQNVLKTQRG